MTRTQDSALEMAALASWRVCGGSVVGADHRRTGRPNQDAWHVERSDHAVIGVVADGCGSAAHSGVGAWLGARIWAGTITQLLSEGLTPTDPQLWSSACARSLERLDALLHMLPGSPAQVTHEALLFTLVGCVVTPKQLVVHAIGDGLVWVDGELTELGPFPDNQPPYLAYGLSGGSTPAVQIIHTLDHGAVERVMLATDGASELVDRSTRPSALDQFAAPRYLERPHAIGRQLGLLNREQLSIDWSAERVDHTHGRLLDDTTLLVLGRALRGPA